jgi:hypothetical protein
MTSRRCPNCGGLVGPDVEWCSQCFTKIEREQPGGQTQPLGERGEVPATAPSPGADGEVGSAARPDSERPERPAPSGPPTTGGRPGPGVGAGTAAGAGSSPGIRATDEGIVWACPVCETENPIELSSCRTCGTPFGRLLEEEPPPPGSSPGRAVALSLLFPGVGHFVAGRGAEGLARAVIFAYAAATVVTILVVTGGRPGPFLSLLVASALVALAVYALTASDAGRAARGEPPLLGSRVLLYGGVALILLTVVVLAIVGLRATGTAR